MAINQMRTIQRLIFSVLLAIFCSGASALDYLELSAGLAEHYDSQFDWNIAGNSQGQNPNILSELIWKDLWINELRLGIKAISNKLYIRGGVAFGDIQNGDNRDSDYNGDNRTLEFSRSDNAGRGRLYSSSLGLGLHHQMNIKGLSYPVNIAPLVGYSSHQQKLSLTSGSQTIPPLGPFAGLNSGYDARWKGNWLGIDLWLDIEKEYTLSATLEYHQVDYLAHGDWNLRNDWVHPISFTHDAQGTGTIASLSLSLPLTPGQQLKLGLEYQDWHSDSGNDRTFLAAGGIIDTQFNEANWSTYAFLVEYSYKVY